MIHKHKHRFVCNFEYPQIPHTNTEQLERTKLLYKRMYQTLNKQWPFMHTFSSSTYQNWLFLFTTNICNVHFLCLQIAKYTCKKHLMCTSHAACACGVLRHISHCQLACPKVKAGFKCYWKTGTSGLPADSCCFK